MFHLKSYSSSQPLWRHCRICRIGTRQWSRKMRCLRSFADVLMAAATKASLSVLSATKDGMEACATLRTPKSTKTSAKIQRLSKTKRMMNRSSIQRSEQTRTTMDKIKLWVAERVQRRMLMKMSTSRGKHTRIQRKSMMQRIMKRSPRIKM